MEGVGVEVRVRVRGYAIGYNFAADGYNDSEDMDKEKQVDERRNEVRMIYKRGGNDVSDDDKFEGME